ncbi:hydroxypyruvate isomerase [Spirochaetia bacterium]|nr:hydroxypyruvate isomerase [Spirochaetia bacterium]
MRFSVCIDAVFKGRDQDAALEGVKAAGFRAYEFWGWWNRDIDAFAKKADALGLSCIGFCTRFIPLTDPGQRPAYLEGLRESIAVAKKLGSRLLISQVGSDTGAVRAFQHKSVAAGLRAAAPLLEENNITLVIEPLNCRINHPGTFLESSDEGFELVEEAGSKNIKLLFDIYHQQITEGDIIRRITANVSRIGHLHAAGCPGRHELFTGELDYRNIFRAADEAGYSGLTGLEYFPEGDASAGLKQIHDSMRPAVADLNPKRC